MDNMEMHSQPGPIPFSMVPMRQPTYSAEHIRGDELGDEIAALSAQLQAATYRLLVLLREFDEIGGWADPGLKSCAHWLSWRIGLSAGAAREKIRVARALGELPLISESMSQGKISYSKVRAVTRVATPENEKELLEIALGGTAGQVERIVRAWRKVDLQAEKEHANFQQDHGSLSTFEDEDGMLILKGRLPSEIGAVFLKALEAASDVVYRKDTERPLEHRRMEALKLISEAALKAELDPGNSADRYQVVVHVDEQVLADPQQPGQSALEGGIGVSAETSRRIACDASVVEMRHDAKGNVLDVGRKTRKIPPALRRALDARDPTCVWPGCHSRYVQAHHIKFWAEGGETKLNNLCNLCHYHHHMVHDGDYRVERLADGEFRFTHPRGWVIDEAPPPAKLPNRPLANIDLEGWEGKAQWGGEPIPLAYVIDTMWRPAHAESMESS